MNHLEYAADSSPHLSSSVASPSSCSSFVTSTADSARQQRFHPVTMNTLSSSSSVATHSPQPADLDPLAFSSANMQVSVSPCPSSSLHTHPIPLQQASESFDQDSTHNTRNLSRLPRDHAGVQSMMHDYWHGQTPLLLHNDPLRSDLDSMEINHSERGIAGFVSKLYQSLQAPDDGQKYARWCKHDGKDMFIIECIPKFTEVVLPRLFKHCKFASFVRQLNIYGFQRDTDARKTKDTKDKESCRWHHPHFRPGRRDLFHLIRRKAARYPRRKRVKIDEDPATIVNVGSGDESDTNTNFDERRRSSSVSSTAVSQQPPAPPSQDNSNYSNNQDFQMMYDGLPELPSQSISLQEQKQPQHQQQSPSPYNPPGEDSEAYTPPVPEPMSWVQRNNPPPQPPPQPLDRSIILQEDLRSHVSQLSQICQGMRKSFDFQIRRAYKLIEDQERRIQALEAEQQAIRGPHLQQQHPSRSSEIGYMINTPFPNHSPHSGDLYQFFPNNTDVRIKSEATPFNDREYGNLYGLKLESSQQQPQRIIKPSDSQQQQWMSVFPNSSSTETPNSMQFQGTPPTTSCAAASIAAVAAVAAAAATAEPSSSTSAPGELTAFGLPGLSKYHHQPNRGI
ncbi:HSF-type DNA-binding-domain-containing protein [Fennellomyces sp. T-0311]|nr:HSF-type DNA-binding-domain-containing protein [Fennellomyces sp. T-0311]